MLLEDFLNLFTKIVFLSLAVLALVDYIRYRDNVRLDILFMFGGFALLFAATIVKPRQTETSLNITTLLALTGLLAQPYLFLRLARHFRDIRRWLLWSAFGTMLISLIITIPIVSVNGPSTLSAPGIIFIIGYFLIVNGYAILLFSREAGKARGITRNRLLLVAGGSGFFALAIVLAGLSSIFPLLEPYTSSINIFFAALAGIAYYLGFATPRWLIRIWQLNELNRFLREATTLPRSGKDTASLRQLCQSSIRAIGGLAALVLLLDETGEQMKIAASEGFTGVPQSALNVEGAAGKALSDRKACSVEQKNELLSTEEKKLATSVSAETLLVIPIEAHEHIWGVLCVFMFRPPFFVKDTLSLLTLFSEQSAYTLENLQLLTEVNRYAEELEQRVEERTIELSNANEELKQFASIVSHDLRAPLLNIRGFSRELRFALEDVESNVGDGQAELNADQLRALSEAFEKDIPEALEFIDSSVIRMDGYLTALLKLSRLGKRELHFETIDVEHLVDDTLKTLGHQIETKKVEIEVGHLPQVYADRISLEQIFGNILTNAVNYLEPSRLGRVVISAESNANEITFSIRDNGRGIAESDSSKVFTPLRRAGSQDIPGEGMGLAYVQTLVRLHKGRIWFESQPGVGTTFFFSISHFLKGGNHAE